MAAKGIERIVVLMLENRSFDHMVGFLRSPTFPINGLTGAESNPRTCKGSVDPPVAVQSTAEFVLAPDPGHEFPDANVQLFCTQAPPAGSQPTSLGFVQSYSRVAGPDGGPAIMECFAPNRLPVLEALAREFAICDNWYSSVPGPTWPNRFFAHAGTSDGVVQMGFRFYVRKYPMRTIYDKLRDAGKSWAIYYHDIPQALALSRLRSKRMRKFFRGFEHFEEDARQGRLPDYSFIEPRYFNLFKTRKANDQHPDHDVRFGEALIRTVYQAVKSSPQWPGTLLVVTYDEHGGFYDHVAPPSGVPNPDGKRSKDSGFEFNFDRLGLRVPTVLVSPLIPRGTIDSTLYEHASLLSTAREAFSLDAPLTKRDAWANPIRTAGWLDSPRDTSDLDSPDDDFDRAARSARMPSREDILKGRAKKEESAAPPNDLQRSLVVLADSLQRYSGFETMAAARRIGTEHDAAVHVSVSVGAFLEKR